MKPIKNDLTDLQREVLVILDRFYPRSVEALDVSFKFHPFRRVVAPSLKALERKGYVTIRNEWASTWKNGRPSRLRDHIERRYIVTDAGRERVHDASV